MRLAYASLLVLLATAVGCGGSQPASTPAPAAPPTPKVVEPKLTTSTSGAMTDEPPVAEAPAEAPAPAPAPAAPIPTDGKPRIESPQPVYNFGEVDNSQDIKHDFIIRNAGGAPLEIRDVKTSCGCTVAQPEKKLLHPGEETKIPATLKLQGKQGAQKRTITVFTNDPDTPAFKLDFEGTAVAAIAIEPPVLAFGMVEDDEPRSMTVSLRATKPDLRFAITDVQITSEDFTLERKTVEEGKHYELEVTLKGGLAPGNYSTRVTAQTDHPDHKNLMLSGFAQVIGEVRISPDNIQIRHTEEPGKTMNMQMQVSPGRVKEFKVLEVVSPVPGMTAEIEERPGFSLIRLSDMPMDDTLEGKALTIKTDIGGGKEFTVPFTIYRPPTNRLNRLHGGTTPAQETAPAE